MVSPGTLTQIFAFLAYASVGLFCYWQLIPRLSTGARRLASLALLVQVTVIAVSLGIPKTSDFQIWLWDVNEEWNIPTTLASVQLALAGSVALLTAWAGEPRLRGLRLYFLLIGIFLFLLAADETFGLHERNRELEKLYVGLGAAVAALAVAAARRSPHQYWKWLAYLLTGLALAGFGAIVVEQFRRINICHNLFFIKIRGCVEPYHYEETLEFLGIWLALVALLGVFSAAAPTRRARAWRILFFAAALWVLLLWRSAPPYNAVIPPSAQPVSVAYPSGIHIHGYSIDKSALQVSLIMYLPDDVDASVSGYSIHVIDQITGDSVASYDDHVNRRDKVTLKRHDYRPLYRQVAIFALPPEIQANHAHWLVLSSWRKQSGAFVPQKVVESDLLLLDDRQVVLDEWVLRASPAVTEPVPGTAFQNGFSLAPIELPTSVRAGETLTISFNWRSDVDGGEDLVQFLHFGHEDSGDWWVYDQQPLGPRLPTRLWYAGLADSETWQVPLPADLAPGRYQIFTGLYRTRDRERIPASGAQGNPVQDARVPLGSLIIE